MNDNEAENNQNNTEIKPKKIPKFTKAQQLQLMIWIAEGLENTAITDRFKKLYYPQNNTLNNVKDRQRFYVRVQYHRDLFYADDNFKHVIRHSQQGLAKMNTRVFQMKKRAGETINKLDTMAEHPDEPIELDCPEDTDPKDTPEYSKTKEYIALNTLLLKQLQHIAEEVGDIRKGGGVQFNIDNRQVIFEGKAVVSQLSEAGMKRLQAENVEPEESE